MLIAMGVCADRVVTSAPQLAPRVAELARSLADRMDFGFCRTRHVPAWQFAHAKDRQALCPADATQPALPHLHGMQSQPFFFRLPPPIFS